MPGKRKSGYDPMEDAAKDYLTSLENVRENAIALGLFAGWALSAACFGLLWWFHNSCKNRRLRIAGIVRTVALIGVLNLLVIELA